MGIYSFAYQGSNPILLTSTFILIAFYCSVGRGQVLKKFDDIAGWAMREEKIFELSKVRVKRLKQELNELEKFVKDYQETTSDHISGVTDPELQEILKSNDEARAHVVASNAMLTYRMTHRLTTMMQRVQRVVLKADPEGHELKEILGAFIDVEQHPNVTIEPVGDMFGQYYQWMPIEDDLEGALDSMVILYDVYNPNVLDPTDFAAMLSIGTSKPVKINAYHATKFSLKAFYLGYYGNALDWANYANYKLENERDYSISKELVHYMREFMGKSHNEEINKPTDFFPEMISYLNFFTDMVNETETWEKRKTHIQNLSPFEWELEDFPAGDGDVQLTTSYYYAACTRARLQDLRNGTVEKTEQDIYQNDNNNKLLKCSLNPKTHPYFYLSPLKVEVLSEKPRILQFHNILSPLEMEALLVELREPQFKSPYPLKEFPDEYGTRKPPLRTGMDAVIDKQTVRDGGVTGILRFLAIKTEYLTGVKILDDGFGRGVEYPGEMYSDVGFKVSEFVGGGYEAFTKRTEEERFGGRIQFYVGTALEGGEVVFGGPKIIVKPVKGSAIFWENIGVDSTEPVDILPASCPVIQGQKIGNSISKIDSPHEFF